MGSMQRFLDRFGPSSEAESVWLQNLFTFIHKHLRTPGGPAHSAAGRPAHPAAADQPGAGASCDQGVCELSVCVVEKIQERSCLRSSRPVSYRPLCVSELLAQQHLACVSNLSWSTNQHRAWAREAELSLPGQRSLPRVNLLLIGWLRAGRGGEWRLEDGSDSVRCEVRSRGRGLVQVGVSRCQIKGSVILRCSERAQLGLSVLAPHLSSSMRTSSPTRYQLDQWSPKWVLEARQFLPGANSS
ncbi:CST complex subunit CTC1-like, partial [Poecilia latipinna]|uniref:CST complex subunit CTC1-like n=1 Tax=Poecilia latipinna TaxID=48699 RepID=UPI00072E71F4